ncbi:hypothetical protein RYH80_11635 [Halobaculum sp. MBLA0147]|uniref:hypothetical protein n=1 Tax=Halobaculum sp. MBLA0147 TaxID=3079934 RepID=UPI003524F5F6
MSDQRHTTRRTVLKTTAGGLAAGGLLGTVGSVSAASGWESVESGVSVNLFDVVHSTNGAFAVGAGGDVLRRTAGGWERVVDGGPTANGNALYGADVTDDGERVWFVGSSGAIGEYDVTTGSLNDYSAPNGVTNNFNDVSVRGNADEANVYVAGDSGKIYRSFENGATGSWSQTTPGSGSAINAVDYFDDKQGHAVDGNKVAFETDDGNTYDRIGISGANVNLYGIDSDGDDQILVSGGGGQIFEYDGVDWTPTSVGDASLRDVAVDAGSGYVVGSGGKVFALGGGTWTEEATPSGANLKGVSLGSVDVAVGASGTILEK